VGSRELEYLEIGIERRRSVECSSKVKEYMQTVIVLNEVKPVRSDFAVLVRFEDQILPALMTGADGSICGPSNIAPAPFVGLVRAFEAGDLAEAARLHRRVLHLTAMYALSDLSLGATKLAMTKLDVPISSTVPGPALPVPPESEEAIDAALEAAGLLPVHREA
jgi:4-hydroxy-tetrahydrodipicolinate synthase